MGFDLRRFSSPTDEELICSICAGVLQDPVQIPSCEHTFCRVCIEEWFSHSPTCPIDRTAIEINQFKPIPRILKNLLNRLNISCENEGCSAIIKLEGLINHLMECEYNPKHLIKCIHGCGMLVSNKERSVRSHNCIEVLGTELDRVKNELEKTKIDLEFYQKEYRKLLRLHHSTLSNDEILRWSNTLQLADVTHWGGMISTPNVLLQESMKNALIESGCPINLTDQLITNAHERYWPEGLSTLETRQVNRQYYANYICRHILDHQAIVILSSDNEHMHPSMIVEPGLMIIFSHGVKSTNQNEAPESSLIKK